MGGAANDSGVADESATSDETREITTKTGVSGHYYSEAYLNTTLAKVPFSELPQIQVDVQIEIPEEVEEIAHTRYNRGLERFGDLDTLVPAVH